MDVQTRRSLPRHPDLARTAGELARARGASFLYDDEVTLVWVSEELRKLLGSPSDEELGIGKHVVEAYMSPVWSSRLTLESQLAAFPVEFPMIVAETPGGKEGLKRIFLGALAEWDKTDRFAPELRDELPALVDQLFEGLEAVAPPPFWASEFEFVEGDLPVARVVEMHVRLHDDSGSYIGTAVLFDPSVPASVLNLLARGDEAMYGRMARLVQPGRHHAAMLFADLEASGVLARRLPSSAYFELVRAITTAIDACIVDERGIVGKHAGDGATAFFLPEDLGSDSATAAAAVRAARRIGDAAARAVHEVGVRSEPVEPGEWNVNVGLHWGGVYMGQIVTGGRLEVTALGDPVNEAARIQESARSGQVLASKSLVEQLSDGDATSVGIDAHAVVYRTVAELSGASDKAIRDAGGIPVTEL